MTDLPQLETLLVGAATRQRRRRRTRRVMVVAALLAVTPLLAREIKVPDPEVTAPTPTPTVTAPTTVEEAYRVFRRPPAELEEPNTRMVAQRDGTKVFLVRRGADLCLSTSRRAGSTMGCGPAQTYLSGEKALVDFSRPRIAGAFPDGVREVSVTYPGERPKRYTLGDNGFSRAFYGTAARVEWRAPDGSPRMEQFLGDSPAAHWARFWDVETPTDYLDQLPGARRVVTEDGVGAWLVPRRSVMCLVVAVADARRSACRSLSDARFPIVIGLDGVIVAAFPDGLTPVRSGDSAIQSNTLVLRGDATVIRYRAGAEERELRIPDRKNLVLHAEPKTPLSFMPYGK